MPAPIMGDDPIAVLQEEQHLGIPVVTRKRPAVAEDDRLPCPPVLVEDLRAICRRDRGHGLPPSVWECDARTSRPRSITSARFVRPRQYPQGQRPRSVARMRPWVTDRCA